MTAPERGSSASLTSLVADDMAALIGHTPLVRLNKVTKGLGPVVWAKLEFFNPGGSVKDRIGLAMVLDAEKRGLLKPGSTIVEPTSGNTGMGLALAAILRGYKIVFTVPDKMSKDKVDLLKAVGAKVRVTPTKVPPGHPAHYVEVARRIVSETPGSFMPNQYENLANPNAHYATTGPEIWEQTGGNVDVLVAGVGTGGTISGTGRFLKEKDPSVVVVGVDPLGSILSAEHAGRRAKASTYKIEGIGEDFLPRTLDMGVIDEFVTVADREAMLMTRRLAREEGILAGTSSGAAVAGALKYARRLDATKTVVVILPDTGRSYLNKVYNDEWMAENSFSKFPGKAVPVKGVWSKIRHRKLVSVAPKATLSEALGLMAKQKVFLLPVMEIGVQVGSLTAKDLLGRLFGTPKGRRVEDAMGPPLPTVEVRGRLSPAGGVLGNEGAVLVADHGKVVGMITTADVISYLDSA
ncbi:MAG: cysteine synthase [Thaumarchaeota archaeon]|nr:cysteine synthase [Nitrososphaerota archaeon]